MPNPSEFRSRLTKFILHFRIKTFYKFPPFGSGVFNVKSIAEVHFVGDKAGRRSGLHLYIVSREFFNKERES